MPEALGADPEYKVDQALAEREHLVSYDDLAGLVDRDRVVLMHEDQRGYLSLASLVRRPFPVFVFRTYIALVSILMPPPLRKYFETHTLFLCRVRPEI